MPTVGEGIGKKRLSRRAQINARKRDLKAMTVEERDAFLAKAAIEKAEVSLVKRTIGRIKAVISSSPRQEDL